MSEREGAEPGESAGRRFLLGTGDEDLVVRVTDRALYFPLRSHVPFTPMWSWRRVPLVRVREMRIARPLSPGWHAIGANFWLLGGLMLHALWPQFVADTTVEAGQQLVIPFVLIILGLAIHDSAGRRLRLVIPLDAGTLRWDGPMLFSASARKKLRGVLESLAEELAEPRLGVQPPPLRPRGGEPRAVELNPSSEREPATPPTQVGFFGLAFGIKGYAVLAMLLVWALADPEYRLWGILGLVLLSVLAVHGTLRRRRPWSETGESESGHPMSDGGRSPLVREVSIEASGSVLSELEPNLQEAGPPLRTLDDSTVASAPGRLRISPFRWARRYPKWPCRLGGALLLSLAFAVFVNGFYWITTALLLPVNWLYWKRVKEHFLHGDANPGLVVQTSPMLIAVRTDLSKGWGDYPVVKVIEEKSSDSWPLPLEVGRRVATVALYSEGDDARLPHWEDFDPRPVEAIAEDPLAARRLLQSFSEDSWQALESGIRQLGKPRPGLFRIEETGCSWAEA